MFPCGEFKLKPLQGRGDFPARVLRPQIIDAKAGRSLNKPARPAPASKTGRPPIGLEVVQHGSSRCFLKIAILPFGTSHDVVVIVTENIGIDTVLTLNACIVVGIVRDIADVEDAERPAGL